jgi:hypothetical protein
VPAVRATSMRAGPCGSLCGGTPIRPSTLPPCWNPIRLGLLHGRCALRLLHRSLLRCWCWGHHGRPLRLRLSRGRHHCGHLWCHHCGHHRLTHHRLTHHAGSLLAHGHDSQHRVCLRARLLALGNRPDSFLKKRLARSHDSAQLAELVAGGGFLLEQAAVKYPVFHVSLPLN